ncbi:MAG: magnesium transporter [Alphaproteobacteria bacterium]|nr:magnesium transporter [Alphaproteobacteria bacterium]
MITVYPETGKPLWVDLHDPSPEEIARACNDYGLEIPPREQLDEIEFSSRLQYEDNVFKISVPVTPHRKPGEGEDETSPLGFVLTKDILVTIRFTHLHTFQAIMERVKRRERSAPDIFLVIVEALIDYGADRLEELRSEALTISRRIFHQELQAMRQHNVARFSRMLRDTLVEIGDMGERMSYIRDTLLVMQRAMPFVSEHGDGWLEPLVKARLKMAADDVQSLNEYEVHLTDKLQFLLDAALGFISTEQNELFKVMTIWSIVGIPPVLFAGIWGMNFHVMPELSWPLGYPMALATIVISGVLPLMWFKHRGWW